MATITSTSSRPLSKVERMAIRQFLQRLYGDDCKVIIKAPSKAEYNRMIMEKICENRL